MRPVNLLPQEGRRRPTGESSRGAYAVLGVLAVLLLMVAAYVLTSNTVTERENETAAARAEADRLEQQIAARGSYANFAQIKATRLASVGGVAQSRFDWERLMRELSRIMPAGSWLQSADAAVSGDPTSGATPATPTAGVVSTGPAANLVGCAPGQSDTARMMVRLREVHRVVDVKLNESKQEAAGENADATVDNCGDFYKFDLTVSFAPGAPAEAPRDSRRVPASLGGGS